MGLIVNKFFLLFSLIFLQACSGGRIGNFLEASFKNLEEPKIKEEIKNNFKNQVVINSEEIVEKNKNIKELKIKDDIENNLNNKIVIKSGEIAEKSKNIKEPKIKLDTKDNLNDKKLIKTEKKLKNNKKNNKKNISFQNKKYQPKAYKIIFILKDVDPKDPTENLRSILRNSDVNFEIEKIERYVDPKNKSLKIY